MNRTRSALTIALALWLVVGCAGGQQSSSAQKESARVATGTFVGEAPEADAFVALIASEAEQGGEGGRQVRAYLCDGMTLNEWFWGTAAGNNLDLSSEGGARLAATLSPESTSGTITLPDGQAVSFRTSPASGIAGLYDVSFASDGTFSGTSADGARLLEARLGEEVNPGIRRIGGTITPSEGEPHDVEAFSGTEAQPGEYRWIVLSDGQAKGGPKEGEAGFRGVGLSAE